MSEKILVIDDHQETVQLIELTLRRHRYTIIGANSGEEGLRLAEAEEPDLILLDMMMPHMNGLDVARAIRQHEKLSKTPIIMFTAKSQVIDKRESFEAGVDDFLTKPTRPAELLERVSSILAHRAGGGISDRDAPGQRTPPDGPASDAGSLITVIGARGGAGATTVAINLAFSLANRGEKTILADLDTLQGHVAGYLGKQTKNDILEWLNLPASNLEEELQTYLVEEESGLHLLLSQPHLDHTRAILHASQVAACTTALLSTQKTVVVDVGHHLGPPLHPLFERSDHIVICLRPQRLAISWARDLATYLGKLRIREGALRGLLLVFDESRSLGQETLENYLGFPLLATLKIDPRALARAVNNNRPLVEAEPDGAPAAAFHRLATQLQRV